jgi:hypothetical protein
MNVPAGFVNLASVPKIVVAAIVPFGQGIARSNH